MLIFPKLPPLSLYVHIPWCVKKCPYCDFNSHAARGDLPEDLYVAVLLQELEGHLKWVQDRRLTSIFFGGGTPSLFSAAAIGEIVDGIAKRIPFADNIEITLEANPGTIEQARFKDFRLAGINRLSLGIQSLQDDKLKILGRIHDSEQAKRAIDIAKDAGFDNFNLDIMYGLPHQTIEEAMFDIEAALSFEPTHFSWYQLTLEPNTLFYHEPPPLPPNDTLWEIQKAGQQYINQAGFQQYEVSAYAKSNHECKHNRNYWEYGDYIGIGAGAHSKVTHANGEIWRFSQVKNPRDYLDGEKRKQFTSNLIAEDAVMFEFMLNALRLTDGVPAALFNERTGINLDRILPTLQQAVKRGLLLPDTARICPTDLGERFLNDLVGMFL